ncbi:MAG: iron-sulfur cluster assembly protein [Anaerolineales bacterium]|nr:iron-sulfur cluster assembly protein [Anaerolineales bacterium]
MTNDPHPPLVWDADATHPELVETLKTALREVLDPEIGLSVIELGLVRNVIITDDQATLHMIMTTPYCPYTPAMLEMTRQKAESTLQRHTDMSLGMEPWDPSMMEDGAAAEWGLF